MTRSLSSLSQLFRLPRFPGLLASSFVLGTAFSFFAPFISLWGTEAVGMSPMGFSLFMTCTSLSAVGVGTLIGRLSDTLLTRRHALMLGALGGAIGYTGYAFVRNPYLLGLIGCTAVALSAACFGQLFAYVREAFRGKVSPNLSGGFITSVVRVCFSFSWTLGPAIGSLVLVHFRFQGLFSAAALLWVLFLIGVSLFVKEQPRPKKTDRAPEASIWTTFWRPDIALCSIAFFALFAALTINLMNLPLAIINTMGGSERDFGIAFGIGPLVEIPFMLYFGQLASRGHQTVLVKLGFVLNLVYFVGLSFAQEPWHVFVLQAVSGMMMSIASNVGIVFFQDLLPEQAGLATAFYTNAQAVGNLAGVLSFGIIVELAGNRGAFVCCAVISLAALVLIAFYPTVGGRQSTAAAG